jgi:hypothetical protein
MFVWELTRESAGHTLARFERSRPASYTAALGLSLAKPNVFQQAASDFLGHPNCAVENCALLDEQHRRNHISVHAAGPANLELGARNKIALNRPVNYAHADVYLRLYLTRLTDDESAAVGCELADSLAVNLKAVGKGYVALDFDAATYPPEV